MIKKLLFKTTPESSLLNETSLLVLRVIAGLLMASLHGFGKMPPGDKLIGGVQALGFPMPVLFAWAAALAELLGGIFLAVGFMTRPAALFMAFTMLVAAFGAHLADPWDVKELSLLYFGISLIFATRGAGKFSIDHFMK
ncbi:DoxX family protein [Bacteriovorax stolpii]|uniref:DoxX family protein n=1 Tax=Bacteriovorax stolpii TaxID=960 RepID=A0A2K9NS25_BACTC|nr:DoxX family protein [Bacteriovorax stolpii]AUN97895.1 DoxX family protein [Bacteriovorax stolpii]TDP51726.1 putative oxidoreductase [Bacteriovorax stolpii]